MDGLVEQRENVGEMNCMNLFVAALNSFKCDFHLKFLIKYDEKLAMFVPFLVVYFLLCGVVQINGNSEKSTKQIAHSSCD